MFYGSVILITLLLVYIIMCYHNFLSHYLSPLRCYWFKLSPGFVLWYPRYQRCTYGDFRLQIHYLRSVNVFVLMYVCVHILILYYHINVNPLLFGGCGDTFELAVQYSVVRGLCYF